MNKMITELCQLLKETPDMIAFEEAATRYMNDTFTKVVSEVFRAVNQHLVAEARTGGARIERNDTRHMTFLFGTVPIYRTLMKTDNHGSFYPLDQWLSLCKHQRYSPLVEVRVAEVASGLHIVQQQRY